MFLSDIAIKRPVFTAMVTIGLMTLGLLGARSLSVDLFPNVEFPIVTVVTAYPGAGPEEVEQQVTKEIEEIASSINGIDEVHSTSRDSVSQVLLVFKLKTDVERAASQVREKVAAGRSRLPRDVKDPVIQRVDAAAMPILTYAIASAGDAAATRRLTEDVVKPRLEAVDGVAAVNVKGGLEREIHVFADRRRLEALGLSFAELAQRIGAESLDLPGGRISGPDSELTVRTEGRVRSIADLEGLVVASPPDGSQVTLADLARVEDGFKETREKPLLDGEPAVVFEVQKQSGSNTVAIADAVYARIGELETQLPADVHIRKVMDSSVFIRQNAREVAEAIVIGGLMAVLVIFLFMLDWRSTLISSLALPTSVVTTFFAMWWLGFSFNMMTLLGLSLAIGLLIDDAVVVRENIYRHMELGEDPVTAAKKGTAQIGLAVMATTFTIVAVFVPVAFMGGMVGQMFREFGLTVAAAVLVSLFVSFTLDPMLSARVVRPVKPGHQEQMRHHRVFGPIVRAYERLDARYRAVLAWALGHRKTVGFSAVALLVATLGLAPLMGSDFVARDDRGEFLVHLEAPAGTSFAQTERIAREAEGIIRANPHVRTLYTLVGPGEETNKAVVRVYTDKKQERPGVPQSAIQRDLRERLSALPSVRSEMADVQMIENLGMDRPVIIDVTGDDFAVLEALAQKVLAVVKATPGTVDQDMSFRPGKPESTVRVDRARAADLGVSAAVLAQTVRTALEGEVVAKYRSGDKDYDVRLQLPPEDRVSGEVVADLAIPALARPADAGGPRLARVSQIAEVAPSSGPATIERLNRRRTITVTSNVVGRSLGEVVGDVERGLSRIDKPAGYGFAFGGQTKNMKETFANMALAILVAIVFIYFVLASQFESLIHPLTIMVALPLALVGALLTLFLTGHSVSMIALIGVILLMGLVTKNSILLVDLTNQLRAEGKSVTEALLEAGPTRLRPILMTSAAMVLGMLPSALSRGEGSEMRAPMALAVIGGVIASTLLTLIVVPVVYTWFDRLRLRRANA